MKGSTVRFVNSRISSKRKDASTWTCRNPLIRLNGLRSRQPYRRLSVFKWITCTVEPHRETKRKWPNLESMSCCLRIHVKRLRSVSWAALKRKIVGVVSDYADSDQPQKWRGQSQRPVVQHSLDRLVKLWKKANCFTLLRRITNSKV